PLEPVHRVPEHRGVLVCRRSHRDRDPREAKRHHRLRPVHGERQNRESESAVGSEADLLTLANNRAIKGARFRPPFFWQGAEVTDPQASRRVHPPPGGPVGVGPIPGKYPQAPKIPPVPHPPSPEARLRRAPPRAGHPPPLPPPMSPPPADL